jgi:Ca2+/Na+ antiporter
MGFEFALNGDYQTVETIRFPYCKDCKNHVHWHKDGAMLGLFKRSVLYFVFLSMVISLPMLLSAEWLGFELSDTLLFLLLFASFVLTSFYAKKKLKTRYPKSPGEHATTDKWAVSISRDSLFSDVDFEFLNQDYAEAFKAANQNLVK